MDYCGDRKKMERSGWIEISLGGRYTDILVGLGIIVEGERGNNNGDWFSRLINEWMFAICNEMVKYPN